MALGPTPRTSKAQWKKEGYFTSCKSAWAVLPLARAAVTKSPKLMAYTTEMSHVTVGGQKSKGSAGFFRAGRENLLHPLPWLLVSAGIFGAPWLVSTPPHLTSISQGAGPTLIQMTSSLMTSWPIQFPNLKPWGLEIAS